MSFQDYELPVRDSQNVVVNAHRLIQFLKDQMPNQPITQIKTMRDLTGWGLKESKDFMESLNPKFYVRTMFGLDGYGPGITLSQAFNTYEAADAWGRQLDYDAFSCEVVQL